MGEPAAGSVRSPAPPAVPLGVWFVALGGGVGTLGRWALTVAWPVPATGGFPWTVLAINVVGSTALAALALLPAARSRPWLALLLGTGVCGGFTTMSTASVDGLQLLAHGHWWSAAGYELGTLAGALAGVLLVRRVGARATGHPDAGGGR